MVLPVTADAASVPMLADIAPQDDEDADGLGGLQLPVRRDGVDTAMWRGSRTGGRRRWPPNWACPMVVSIRGCRLAEIGVDSIMTVALRKQLERKTGLALPPTLLWEHPTAPRRWPPRSWKC